jgi:hypothetical protein
MLKAISAALLAASIIAAPAFAAGSGKNLQSPTMKTAQLKTTDANAKPQTKPASVHSKKDKHHVKHVRNHRSQQRTGALKTHRLSKVSIKHTAPIAKRG